MIFAIGGFNGNRFVCQYPALIIRSVSTRCHNNLPRGMLRRQDERMVRSDGHEHIQIGIVGVRNRRSAQRQGLHPQAQRPADGGEATEDDRIGEPEEHGGDGPKPSTSIKTTSLCTATPPATFCAIQQIYSSVVDNLVPGEPSGQRCCGSQCQHATAQLVAAT